MIYLPFLDDFSVYSSFLDLRKVVSTFPQRISNTRTSASRWNPYVLGLIYMDHRLIEEFQFLSMQLRIHLNAIFPFLYWVHP